MIKLLSLTFNNIGRFTEEQTIRFDNRGKTIQINGLNSNTGGSSGSGKTTVINAIDYNLGLSDVPSTILQSRLTKKHAYVIGEYLVDGKSVTIKRSRKVGEGLTIITPDETVSGNVKLAEEKLDELIGIPRKLFKKMIHKKQKKGGFFLEMTAKEVYEFFVELLGLKKYTDQVTLIDQDLKSVETEMIRLGHARDAFQSSIDEYNLLFDGMKEPTCDVSQAEIDLLNTSISKLQEEFNTLTNSKDANLGKLIPPCANVVADFDDTLLASQKLKYTSMFERKNQAIQDHSLKVRNLNNSKSQLQQQLIGVENAKKQAITQGQCIKELKNKQEEIRKSMCPTCKQTWVGTTAQDEINKIDNQLALLIDQALAFKALLESEPKLIGDLGRLENIIAQTPMRADTNGIEEAMVDLNSYIVAEEARKMNIVQDAENKYLIKQKKYSEQVQDIKSEYEPKLAGIFDELTITKQNMSSKIATLNAFKTSNDEFIASRTNILKLVGEKTKGLNETIDKRSILGKRIDVANEAKRLIKTYTLQIFQETLETIGDLATQTLSGIPNMATSTVYFEGCKENKNGTIKDEISPILNMDGENSIPIKSLCGGERTSIDLAVDLAVIDTIETKTGKGADFFVVDEPFTGLEDVNIEQCLDILQQMDTNKKIIIIDHNEKVKQAVSDIITVERAGENSKILI